MRRIGSRVGTLVILSLALVVVLSLGATSLSAAQDASSQAAMSTANIKQVKAFMTAYVAEFNASPTDAGRAAVMAKYIDSPALVAHINGFQYAIPGYQLHPEDLVVEMVRVDDEGGTAKVAVPMMVTGTYERGFGGVPGSAVSQHAIYVYTVQNGKIVGFQGETDYLHFLQDIGVMPKP